MIELFGISLGNIFQGATFLGLLAFVAVWWVRGMPDRTRASTADREADIKAASDIRDEYALRYKETRVEVHALRNELAKMGAELQLSLATSTRRGDKLNMLRFILQLVIDELASKDKNNKVLEQARKLLSHIDEEPHKLDSSDALQAAEDTVDQACETVRQVKAEEAKSK